MSSTANVLNRFFLNCAMRPSVYLAEAGASDAHRAYHNTERILTCLEGLASRDITIENPPAESTAGLPDGPEGERLKKVHRDFFAVRMDFHQEAAQWILSEWERLGGKSGDI
jgi:hypothetical protein